MSTLREPVGPKDRKVYFRRRLLVLAGIVAVLAVIVLIIVKPGSSGGAEGNPEVAVPSDLIAAEKKNNEAKKAKETPECALGQLVVTPLTDLASYGPGEQPRLSLTVENTGEEACVADLGTAGMTFEISSGDDQVWRSVDCQDDAKSLPIIVEPEQVLTSESIEWDRTRSSTETCDITRDPVAAEGASYHLKVAVADVKGTGTAQFLLH